MGIRLLIVDDSTTALLLLSRVLGSDSEIEIVGTASSGEEGVQKALRLKPDVITMDIFMSGMDGYEATRQIMRDCPTPIVVVSGGVASPELMIAFKSIQAGALDMVQKPDMTSWDFDASCRRLITVVKLMSEVRVVRRRRVVDETISSSPRSPAYPSSLPKPAFVPKLIAIVSSTGGPAALNQIFKTLPADFSVPIVVIQHISAGFTQGLIHWLQTESRLRLQIATHGERLAAGRIYFSAEGRHLEVSSLNRLLYTDDPPVHFVRPAATVLFNSVARNTADSTIGVMLTGMGEDGAAALKTMRDRGSINIVQDEATSVVFGMPGAAVKAGAADYVLPVELIGAKLQEMARANVGLTVQ